MVGVTGVTVAGGLAVGALEAFRQGQTAFGWAFVISGASMGLGLPAATLLTESNRVWGIAATGGLFGGCMGSALGAGAYEAIMAGDVALGCILAFVAVAVAVGMRTGLVGMPTGLAFFFRELG